MDNPATISDLVQIMFDLLNLAIRLAGIATFIMIVIGGFKYLTAGGDPKAAESAKNTLTYAILGLVLIIAAWFIIRFIAEFTGVSALLEFKLE